MFRGSVRSYFRYSDPVQSHEIQPKSKPHRTSDQKYVRIPKTILYDPKAYSNFTIIAHSYLLLPAHKTYTVCKSGVMGVCVCVGGGRWVGVGEDMSTDFRTLSTIHIWDDHVTGINNCVFNYLENLRKCIGGLINSNELH